ncbi:hypothetical protein EV586_103116 [Tumebacillus sp. BK434]|uniref:hypothetical protein n=1 Tax=Tumebacillus sp. BK434 TaxID=2512169 RepID=UPI00104E2D12|nr:hypothetical protein [Tumebacillus sp. BK434]TCP55464.1 hypothetical protein EV586_103116 [Tumebacillus sp. BK434]
MNALSSLFQILFRPHAVLDDLLFEGDLRKSWRATGLLACLDALIMLLVVLGLVILVLAVPEIREDPLENVGIPKAIVALLLVLAVPVVFLLSWLVHAVSRYWFSGMVRLGLRVSAGAYYPRDTEERREKGRQLQLIHPYTAGISWIPSQAVQLLYLATLFGGVLVQSVSPSLEPPLLWTILILIFALLNYVVPFGSHIYMVIVRVMAIQKLYGISGARAFWGPFLIYALLYGGLFVLVMGFAAWSFMTDVHTVLY